VNIYNLHGHLELDWINKDKSLLYEIDEEEGAGVKPIWVEKDDIRVSEPRISKLKGEYGDPNNENMLIKGDNLLALRTLVEEFKNRDEKDKVKCIYIDPPFNTGTAFEHYDDNLEHSQWLTMMRDRLILLKNLLRSDGFIIVHLDDRELAYCKILMDEVFGRDNFKNIITMTTNAPSGFKATGKKVFSTSNFLLIYSKSKDGELNQLFIEKKFDTAYSKYLENIDEDYKNWKWKPLAEVVAVNLGFDNKTEATLKMGKSKFDAEIEKFAIQNAGKVFRTAAIGGGAAIKRRETIELSKKNRNEIFVHPNEDIDGFYILNGEQILFYEDRLVEINGERIPGMVITDVWSDISWTGIANEGNVKFKNSKKPEKLIKRIIEMSSFSNDLILDSFLGSGTTVAVAHKMGRKWIGIEIGKHAKTLCIPRLQRVIRGEDMTGISKEVNWQGGGGFRYYEVGESVIKDLDMNWEMTLEEMSRAVFMNFGFLKQKEKLVDGVFVGKSRKKGQFALCTATKNIEIVKFEELMGWLKTLKEKYGEWTEVELYTNKGVGIRSDVLPDGMVLKKIPESLLAKYNL